MHMPLGQSMNGELSLVVVHEVFCAYLFSAISGDWLIKKIILWFFVSRKLKFVSPSTKGALVLEWIKGFRSKMPALQNPNNKL